MFSASLRGMGLCRAYGLSDEHEDLFPCRRPVSTNTSTNNLDTSLQPLFFPHTCICLDSQQGSPVLNDWENNRKTLVLTNLTLRPKRRWVAKHTPPPPPLPSPPRSSLGRDLQLKQFGRCLRFFSIQHEIKYVRTTVAFASGLWLS